MGAVPGVSGLNIAFNFAAEVELFTGLDVGVEDDGLDFGLQPWSAGHLDFVMDEGMLFPVFAVDETVGCHLLVDVDDNLLHDDSTCCLE